MSKLTVGFALCGSFCTFDRAVEQMRLLKGGGALQTTAGGLATSPAKGVRLMPITLTFHLFGCVITIKVKSENRHPGR
mgnify:CR=1 FL=1